VRCATPLHSTTTSTTERTNAHTTTSNACEMPDPTYELWCLFQGDTVLFPVTTSPTTSIGTLKKQIKVKGERTLFSGIDALSLNLWQVRCF